MSKNQYPFVLPRDWAACYQPHLKLESEGDFIYNDANPSPDRTRLRWNVYSNDAGHHFLVMVLSPFKGQAMIWQSMPIPIDESQEHHLPSIEGSDVGVSFCGSRRVWDKFMLALTLQKYLERVTRVPCHASVVKAMASDYHRFLDNTSDFLERYLSDESVSRINRRRVLDVQVLDWEY